MSQLTIDIDADDWIAPFNEIFEPTFPKSKLRKLLRKRFEYREDFVDAALEMIDPVYFFYRINEWARLQLFICRHATRLTNSGLVDVSANGLKPLEKQNLFKPLAEIITSTSTPASQSNKLKKLRRVYDEHKDRNNGVIFFSLSERNLKTRSCSHYLFYGSEFAQVALNESGGRAAKLLFRNQTIPIVISYLFPGSSITEELTRRKIEEILENGNRPPAADLLLSLWVYWRRFGSITTIDPPIDFTHFHRGDLPNAGMPTSVLEVPECEIETPWC